MTRKTESTQVEQLKTLLVCVQAPGNPTRNINAYFDEFRSLVDTSNYFATAEVTIKLRSIDPAHFLTKGKLQEIKEICIKNEIEIVILSDVLSVQQERNLTDFLDCTIIDRTKLILEIFEAAAQSAEGKLQVGIAMLKHKKSRLSGKGIHLAQQRGNIGMRAGPGEKAKVREARHIEQLILRHSKELERLERVRATQRKQRLRHHLPLMALIGYTNAGKSTILNTLTKADVLAEDKLFATLDTTTRTLFINGKQTSFISDTVGFIQQLPHHLINAFKSTLSELQFADLLLHIVDLTDPSWQEHIAIVHDILKEIDVNKPVLYVFNKCDAIEKTDAVIEEINKFTPHVVISATSKQGIEPLITYLSQWQPIKQDIV